jgi:hypothetical protein
MTTLRNTTPPGLPVAPSEYQQRYQDQFANVLRLYFNSISNAINAPKPFGVFYDTTTQTNPVANTANAVTFDRENGNYAVTRGVPTSKIYVSETGVYNVQFSVQLDKTNASSAPVYIWLRVNGQDSPHTASKVIIAGSDAELIPAWNFMLTLKAGDYVQLIWSSSSTNVVLAAFAASSPVPAIPSIILSINWISGVPV